MLLALAIVGILFGAITFQLFSLSQIWLNRTENDYFPEHVEGVTNFIQTLLNNAETTVSPSTEEGENTLPVAWRKPPDWSDLDDPLIGFHQPEAPVLFVREGEPLPAINAYLYWEKRDGLSILWYSDLDPEVEAPKDLFNTIISPHVSLLEYCYYDAEKDEWEIEEEPEKGDDRGSFILPQFLKITFTHEDKELVRYIYIPQRNPDVPLF